ncbi:MAG TPA: NAD(P)/FAD-dependent oxidoreductase [Nitrospira sp.]|nr:NAD(P)/FAD-dependent oxidoreductase [Nitrospira sp.]
MKTYDIGIIGAGVVGCAIARELGDRRWHRPLRIITLERCERAGTETSGRNSGVLHSGIHEHPGSLKARLAREGSALAVAYAVQHNIPLLRSGMLIAISRDDIRRGLWRELSTLRRLWLNAWRSNIRMSFVTASGLRALEPHLRASCGIVIPSVCVIDSLAFVQSLKHDAAENGVEFSFQNRVIGIEDAGTEYLITTDRQQIRVSALINAAGLHADDIAALALSHQKYRIRPIRGEYYELVTASKKGMIGRLVYPALPRNATGKGIHFGPRPNGQLFVGPNEVPVQDKSDYLSHRTPPGAFIEALQKFLPALEEADLRWGYSGIRPCVMIGEQTKSDFIVSVDRDTPLLVNLIGIESPGLSAAMALARHVTDLPCIQQRFRPMGSSFVDHSR